MSERIKEPSHTDNFRSSMRSESIDIANQVEEESGTPALEPSSLQSTDEGDLEPRSLPAEHGLLASSNKKQPPAVPPHRTSLRNRAPSDPFLDPGDKLRGASSPPVLSPRQLPISPTSPTTDLASPDLSTATSSTPFLTSSGLPSPDPVSPSSPPPISRPPQLAMSYSSESTSFPVHSCVFLCLRSIRRTDRGRSEPCASTSRGRDKVGKESTEGSKFWIGQVGRESEDSELRFDSGKRRTLRRAGWEQRWS